MPEQKNLTMKLWKLSEEYGAVEHDLPDLSSMDGVTRQLPHGFYTTFRTYGSGKRVLGLRAHLQRLYQPAAMQKIDPSVAEDKLRRALAEILHDFPQEARVRVILTGDGQVYIALEPLKPLPAEVYSQGVRVITTGVERKNPRLKSTSFISSSQSARDQMAGSDVFEALLVRNGRILEGITSNFFYIWDGKVGTARDGILLGVTRRSVLRVARGFGLEIVYQPLEQEQIAEIDEAFLTSSSRGIVPIVKVDRRAVGEGSPGQLTQKLMKAYQDFVLRTAEEI